MTANHFKVGEAAHDSERNAIHHVVSGLPGTFTVYSNAWLVEPNGTIFETDLVVVAPHAIYVVEVKGFRGRVEGNDNDWYVPEPIRNPLKLNRLTAQKLRARLKAVGTSVGRAWVEGLVFLSNATSVAMTGPASVGRVHLRKTILAELQDPAAFVARNTLGATTPVDAPTREALHRILTGVNPNAPPPRRVREYALDATLDRTERYVEHLAHHAITGEKRVLRVYTIPPLAHDEARRKVEDRCRWEAQVLSRVAAHPNVLHADPPFLDEAGMCLPFYHFEGVTLASWVERHHKKHSGKPGLRALVTLWREIALALAHAHRQGVVHRLLRPDVVLFENVPAQPQVRVTGFDLAKQTWSGQTLAVSTLTDERLRYAAPEVVANFSDATPAADQFGLGLLLGWMLAGKALVESTRELVQRKGPSVRLRDVNPFVPQSLDEAVLRMLAVWPNDRYPDLDEALRAVARAVDLPLGDGADRPPDASAAYDPENLPEGTRIGTDYEVTRRLGSGGLATVYAALHLVSGRTRALKVARADPRAIDALRGEHQTLKKLQHPAIVRVFEDLSQMVPGRLTMVMEQVKGETLRDWLVTHTDPDPRRLRQYAEDLFGALAYLETQGVTHKDLKPDNLIVGDDGLTVIDFSLVDEAREALVGTALYRDPALRVWDHAADRYAAALCLFELYVGRHAFKHAPAPGEEPSIDPDDLDPPGLMGFFRKALSPLRDARYPSAAALRAGFLEALGGREPVETTAPESVPPVSADAQSPIAATALKKATVAALRRMSVHTQGDLVALSEARIKTLEGLGNRKKREVLAVRQSLLRRGVRASAPQAPVARAALFPTLEGDTTGLHALDLPSPVVDTLLQNGFTTVGALAVATRDDLVAVPGIQDGRVTHVVAALQDFARQREGNPLPTSWDDLWAQLVGTLKGPQAEILAALHGFAAPPLSAQSLAAEMDLNAAEISRQKQKAHDRLRELPLVLELVEALTHDLDAYGGVLTLDEAARRLAETWPATDPGSCRGPVRLLCALHPLRLPLRELSAPTPREVVTRFEADTLRRFLDAARDLADWHLPEKPPTEPEATLHSLKPLVPGYPSNPCALATRLWPALRTTEGHQELYVSPLAVDQAIAYVLRRERLPMSLAELARHVTDTFGDGAPTVDPGAVAAVIAKVPDCRLEGERLVAPPTRTLAMPRVMKEDDLPPELRVNARTPEETLGEMLRGAARQPSGYRLVVTPPESHPEVGRSVWRALGEGAVWVSFEERLLARMEPDFAAFERAERYKAQRTKLTREADALLDALFAEHGTPGRRVVLGDTAILGVCEATHIVRRVYDETTTGRRGFWVVVIPGVIHQRQPYFNETDKKAFDLPGTTYPLHREIP
jgi:serine/threonine protein kinase